MYECLPAGVFLILSLQSPKLLMPTAPNFLTPSLFSDLTSPRLSGVTAAGLHPQQIGEENVFANPPEDGKPLLARISLSDQVVRMRHRLRMTTN